MQLRERNPDCPDVESQNRQRIIELPEKEEKCKKEHTKILFMIFLYEHPYIKRKYSIKKFII